MRVERKCLICNMKYYSPDQDQHHEHGGQGRKTEHEAVEVASPSHTEIQESHIEISESVPKKIPEKKIKKIPKKKVDKRSREYRQSIGR